MKTGDGLKEKYRQEIIRILSENPRVERIVLFGSRAMGTFTPESDIDIVLYGDDLSLTDLAQLKQALEETTIPQKVDLLLAKDIEKKELLEHIKKYGVDWWRRRKNKQPLNKDLKKSLYKKDEWQKISLGQLFKVKHGFAFKGKYFIDIPQKTLLVTPGNFAIGGGFQNKKPKYYDGPYSSEYVLKPGQLIISMTDLSKHSDTLGCAAIIPDDGNIWLHNQRIGLVILKEESKADLKFLHYLLRTRNYRSWIIGSASGTTVKHTSPSRIEEYRFEVPPLPEQRAIAHILGTLDDKIELNREMNKTLEEMAQAIFKSWFVDFDPVVWKAVKAGKTIPEKFSKRAAYYKESGKCPVPKEILGLFPDSFQDSELGPIPKGWSVKTFPEIIAINPKRKLKKGQIAPYLEMKNLPENSARALGWYYRKFSSGVKFINGDTLMARITPCLEKGKGAFVDFLEDGQTGWGSTEYIVFRSKKPLPLEYAYFLSRTKEFRSYAIVNMTGSSGRQRVPASIFSSYRIVKPNDKVSEYFGKIARSIMEKMKINDAASSLLSSLRDTLLPKLISGELRVPDVEKFIKEAGL